MPDCKPLLESLWEHASVIRIESWASGEPEFPERAPGDASKREFRVARINERALLLLRELGTDLDPEVRLLRNVRNTSKSVYEALALEEYDGWFKNTLVIKELHDQTADMQKFLSEHYNPLQGSDITALKLANLLGLWNGTLGHLHIREGKALILAIDGKRTGITNGHFIHDTSFLYILAELKFDFELRSFVSKNNIDPSVINDIWTEQKETRGVERIAFLEKELASAEAHIRNLRQELARIKTTQKRHVC